MVSKSANSAIIPILISTKGLILVEQKAKQHHIYSVKEFVKMTLYRRCGNSKMDLKTIRIIKPEAWHETLDMKLQISVPTEVRDRLKQLKIWKEQELDEAFTLSLFHRSIVLNDLNMKH